MSSNSSQSPNDEFESNSAPEADSTTLSSNAAAPTTPPPLTEEHGTINSNPIDFINTSVFVSIDTPSKHKSLVGVKIEGKNGEEKHAFKETHNLVDQANIGELADAMLIIDDAIQTSLPDKKLNFSTEDVLNHFLESSKKTSPYKGGQWTGFKSTRQAPMEPKCTAFLEKIAQKAETYIKKQGGGERLRHYSDAFYNKPVKDDACDRKPDVILPKNRITPKDIKSGNLPKWDGIDVAIEIRKARTDAKGGHDELAESARLIFRHQPNRRSVFGVVLAGDEMTFCIFDRSGKVSSPSFNIHKQPALFLRVVVGLCYIDRETLGFDKTVNLEGPKDTWSIDIGRNSYPIKNIVYTEGVVRGRGTACYEVLKDGESALVKDNWVDMSREGNEADTMKSLQNIDHHQHIPKVKEDETVQFEDADDTTARIRMSLLRKVLKDGKETFEWKDEEHRHMELRRHERIVITPFGMKIEQFRSLEELLNAIKHIALVIRDFHKRDVLHRDISLRNVLLQELEGRLQGLLIDYDYAITSARAASNAVGHRTGTIPFMAIEILDPRYKLGHAYFHDLESLFYVLCWICIVQGGPCGAKRRFNYLDSHICVWNAGGSEGSERTMKNVSVQKADVMANEDHFRAEITDDFADYFKPIIPCVLKLRELLFVGVKQSEIEIARSKRLLEVLEKAVNDEIALDDARRRVPLRFWKWEHVFEKFIEILEKAVESLPPEHKTVPWKGKFSEDANNDAIPVIEQKRVVDIQGVMDAELRRAENRNKANLGSRGTKRTLNMDACESPTNLASASSKRLRASRDQRAPPLNPRTLPSMRASSSRSMQTRSETLRLSASTSSFPMPPTPPDLPSRIHPEVQIAERRSQILEGVFDVDMSSKK